MKPYEDILPKLLNTDNPLERAKIAVDTIRDDCEIIVEGMKAPILFGDALQRYGNIRAAIGYLDAFIAKYTKG